MAKKSLWFPLVLLLIFFLSSLNMSARAQVNDDVAVTEVIPASTLVQSGEAVNITVVVENHGAETEAFNVTLFHDSIIIEMKEISDLTSGQNTTLVFVWNTADVINEIDAMATKDKTYNIKAEATLLADSDPADNTLTSPSKIKVVSQYIAVRPQRTVDETLTTGKNYVVTVYTDYDGTDVWGWQFSLTFSPAVLECVEIRNGDLITTTKNPDARFEQDFNNTAGELSAGAFFYYDVPPPTVTTFGPGSLANVTFKVVGTGHSNITLVKDRTKLLAYNPSVNPDEIYDVINDYKPGLNHLLSGYFSNAPTGIVDIAIISIKPAQTKVTQGDEVNINVTIKNQGTLDQTFDVKLYYGYNPGFPGLNVIETKTMQSLSAGATKTLISVWNTTEAKEGTYVVTAIISGVQGDVDMSNNRLDGSETVTVNLEELRPLPITELIIGAVAVIAVIVVISFVLRRRRKKPPLEEIS